MNIDDEGYIIVSVDIAHDFDGKIPLDKEIANGNVETGEEVKDPSCGETYEYIGIAPFTISETNEYMKQSIVEYYAQKEKSYITAGLSPDTKAVLTKTGEGEIYPYIPSRLRKVIRLESLHGAADSVIKINADKKMRKTIDAAVNLTWTSGITRMDGNKDLHEKIIKNAILCKNSGYYTYDLQMPVLRFGGEHTCGYSYGGLMHSINDFGPYRKKRSGS